MSSTVSKPGVFDVFAGVEETVAAVEVAALLVLVFEVLDELLVTDDVWVAVFVELVVVVPDDCAFGRTLPARRTLNCGKSFPPALVSAESM